MNKILISYFTVPPQKPIILSEDSEEIEHTGPYFEGDRVKLTCMVSGGNFMCFYYDIVGLSLILISCFFVCGIVQNE